MPKKFPVNSKQTEARARKEAVRQNEKLKKDQELEDAAWKDDDKNLQKKLERKEAKDKKQKEQLDRKNASKTAYEEEMNSIQPTKAPPPTKISRAEIAEKLSEQAVKNTKTNKVETPLEENVNRTVVENEARSVEDAIAVLGVTPEKLDRHPERRVKAAYEAFEDAHLPRLKAENPNLRLSQLKQMLKKDWMKSPENPLNQRQLAYNSKS